MGVVASLKSWLMGPGVLENPGNSLSDPDVWDSLTGGTETEAGILVTPEAAMTLAPVWQGASIISGDFASATAHVYEKDDDGNREHSLQHPADYLISVQPNEEMSAFELWRRFMIHCLIWQQGFIYVHRQGRVGKPLGMYNLLPDRTCPKRDDNGQLYYTTEVGGQTWQLHREEVIHVKGLSVETDKGCELVKYARNSWGLSLAAEGYGSKFFANGAQAGGIIELPIGMGKEAAENIVKGVQKKYTGKDNWFRTMILRDGAKFHATTIDAQKSQLTELREHQVRETARFFNLPPGKLGLEDSVSYNSAEQAQIQYITGCLTHWFSAVRGELQIKLFTAQERRSRRFFIEFNTSKLIERDLKTTVEILEIERRNEIINAAEWRRKVDLPPRTDPAALEYTNPNVKPAGSSEPTEAEPEEDDDTDESDTAVTNAARGVMADAVNRMARRVSVAARKASKKGPEFEKYVEARNVQDFRLVVDSASVMASAAIGLPVETVRAVSETLFYDHLKSCLSPCLDGPASQLESNADAACTQFESTVSDAVCDFVFRKRTP